MKTEQQMEKVIAKKNRGQFYNYYLHLGYDHKTAACLALFTYGDYRFEEFSMDKLYETLSEGKEYLPPEVLEARMHRGRIYSVPAAASAGTGFAPLFDHSLAAPVMKRACPPAPPILP